MIVDALHTAHPAPPPAVPGPAQAASAESGAPNEVETAISLPGTDADLTAQVDIVGNGYVVDQIPTDLAVSGDHENGYVAPGSSGNLTVRLSKLQRWMLVRAHQNRLAGEKTDLFYGEVLAHYYQFCLPEDVRTRNVFMGKFFDPELIGRSRYNAACAAVSRAAVRLDRRGLARCMRAVYGHWASIRLTDAGMSVAASLSAAPPAVTTRTQEVGS